MATRARGVLTPAEAAKAIKRLRPGETLVYFVGDLAVESAQLRPGRPAPGKARSLTIRAQAIAMLSAFMRTQGTSGEVVTAYGRARGFNMGRLLQKKLARSVYEYRFVRHGRAEANA